MTETTDRFADREEALVEFDRARDGFQHCYDAVPDEALGYVPAGEDYTLGGLAVHVTQTLYHYGRVLDQMRSSGYQPLTLQEPPDDPREAEMVRKGFPGAERASVFGGMRVGHDHVAARVRALEADEYARVAPVIYGEGQDPYDTRAVDVMGWVIDHYRDHTQQVADLLASWRASR